ncbi:MAG: hypothetical protein CMQ81_00430 [Gammaproteobacteria bacterium]|nr:hypothetical protein [Gammaproteobacteria bacterium]
MLDLLIIFILLITSVIGFFRGFNKEVRNLISLITFAIIYYFFIENFNVFIQGLISIPQNFYPNYSYPIISILIIYIFSVLIVYFTTNFLFGFLFLSKNILPNKFLGIFMGFFKGFAFIIILFLLLNYYSLLEYFINFDKNSLFLDYFLEYGVQLPYVWNHWNS